MKYPPRFCLILLTLSSDSPHLNPTVILNEPSLIRYIIKQIHSFPPPSFLKLLRQTVHPQLLDEILGRSHSSLGHSWVTYKLPLDWTCRGPTRGGHENSKLHFTWFLPSADLGLPQCGVSNRAEGCGPLPPFGPLSPPELGRGVAKVSPAGTTVIWVCRAVSLLRSFVGFSGGTPHWGRLAASQLLFSPLSALGSKGLPLTCVRGSPSQSSGGRFLSSVRPAPCPSLKPWFTFGQQEACPLPQLSGRPQGQRLAPQAASPPSLHCFKSGWPQHLLKPAGLQTPATPTTLSEALLTWHEVRG